MYRGLSGPQVYAERLRKILTPTGVRTPDLPSRNKSLYLLTYGGPWRFAKFIINEDLDAFMRTSPSQFAVYLWSLKMYLIKPLTNKHKHFISGTFCARVRVFEIIQPKKGKVPNSYLYLKSALQNALSFLKIYRIKPVVNKHIDLLYFRYIFVRGSGFSR